MIRFECSACGARLKAKGPTVDRGARCPRCNAALWVAEAPSAERTPAYPGPTAVEAVAVPPHESDAGYYLSVGGTVTGPHPLSSLRSRAAGGTLPPDAQLCSTSGTGWIPASIVLTAPLRPPAAFPAPPEAATFAERTTGPERIPRSARPRTATEAPWHRRAGNVGAAILAGIFCFPPLLCAACLVCLTGDVYTQRTGRDGFLETWHWRNKIAAALLLVFGCATTAISAFKLVAGEGSATPVAPPPPPTATRNSTNATAAANGPAHSVPAAPLEVLGWHRDDCLLCKKSRNASDRRRCSDADGFGFCAECGELANAFATQRRNRERGIDSGASVDLKARQYAEACLTRNPLPVAAALSNWADPPAWRQGWQNLVDLLK